MANKFKTHSGAAKRFKFTGAKKNRIVFCSKEWNNHLLTNKWKTNKKFKGWKKIVGATAKMFKNLLPYK